MVCCGAPLFPAAVTPVGGAVSLPRTLSFPSTTQTWSATVCDLRHRSLAVIKEAQETNRTETEFQVRVTLPSTLSPGLYLLVLTGDQSTRRVKIHVDP